MSPRTRALLPPLAAAVAALVAYAPSLGGGFLYDDFRVVVENRGLRDLGDLPALLRADPSRPLLSLTFALNYAMGGLRPLGYHAVNVLLHAANAALLASLALWIGRRREWPAPERAALLAGCVFAATPMAAETVAYVTSRSSALAALLSLACVRVGASALERRSAPLMAAAVALGALALGAKEEAACAPALLLLVDDYAIARGRLADLWSRRRFHAPLLALPVLGLVARREVLGAWLPAPVVPRSAYLLTQAVELPGYLLRSLVPLDPALYRGVPLVAWPPPPGAALLAAVALALLASAVALRARAPLWAFVVLWFTAALAPSSSLVPLKEMVVDHRAYLAGAAVAILVGRFLSARGRLPFAVLLLALFAARAARYEWILADPQRAWEDAVRRAPSSSEAYFGLAEALAARQDGRAEAAYAHAAELAPGDARGWANLGYFYVHRGQLVEAERATRRAVETAPQDSRLHENLALILQGLGRRDEALQQLELAVALPPPLARSRIDLAAALLERGEKVRARQLVDQAAGLAPDDEELHELDALRARLSP